jgi:hypothetical protein
MKKYRVTVPGTEEMSPYVSFATHSPMESLQENALWHYNSARAHDGLPPLSRMPYGTQYRPDEDI